MADEYEISSERGSIWHRWDPHIHTPGTALNDQYSGSDPWESFLTEVETSNPPIRALGITDYSGIDLYEKVIAHKENGRLANVGLIFPNVEFRLSIETSKASAVNLHLLFSPHDHDHVERIKRFLLGFEFSYQGETYRYKHSDLVALGKAHNKQLIDTEAAKSEGANQFKINFEQLKEALNKNDWVKNNTLIAVSGGEKDGTSGLRDSTASFAALRKNVEGLANIVFSSNPKQIQFWLGKGPASIDELNSEYNGCKPCLHGSDAHSVAKVGQPDGDRRCWIKGDLTFESLRQVCIEPRERVHIGPEHPRGALAGNTINNITVTNASWLAQNPINLNSGLVAVIGARGSGKTALADLIAAGALALSPHLNERSFILRAKVYLEESEANLSWLSGEQTGNHLKHTDMEELIDSPHVQYLSQQFVDQLCSAEGLNGELITEIERVIFNSHPLSERSGASSFKELLQIRLESSTQKRERQHETLKKASSDLTEERVKKDGLKALEKEFEETKKNIEKDKADRTSLVSKGNEERAKRHEEISLAVDAKRQLVEQAKRRHQTLIYLQNDVLDFRSRVATSMLTELKNDREDASLTSEDWESFRVDYVGQVDVLLADKIKQVHSLVAHLQGPSKSDPAILQDADPNISLIAGDFSLEEQTLDLLQREQSRLRNLIGIDAENAKRFTLLSDKITKSESALAKLGQQIERIQGADERIQTLLDTRRSAYAGVIEAIIEEENELVSLYKPIKERIDNSSGSLSKLSFSVRRNINIDNWAAIGEGLLDLRTNGPFKGRGELLNLANENLLPAWSTGDASQIAAALLDFAKTNESALKAHRPDAAEYREWALKISNWLYSTGHITVGYGLQYDEVDIEQLSPGTRGIVLLLLYLAIDAEDDRPLIIDQPEENLDPQSIFQELVHRFREAKMRRQIIIVMSIGV